MTAMQQDHPTYLLTITVQRLEDRQGVIELGKTISSEYMERWGEQGAMTVFVYRSGDNTYHVGYTGPEESTVWLEDRIVAGIQEAGGLACVHTVEVEDLTERF